jgi:uncharacterized protein YndB with AHSA1/START domain
MSDDTTTPATKNPREVSVSRVIPATPERIFAVLTSPAGHAAIDGSGTVRAPVDGEPERLELGTKFGMKMKVGVPYKVANTVVEYEPNRLIAWRHFNGHRWRHRLDPDAGGTTETETFDWSTARMPWTIELMGYPRKHIPNMTSTLELLEEYLAKNAD